MFKDFFTLSNIAKEGLRFVGSYWFNFGGHPLAISLMLTNCCNNNCRMCFEKDDRENNANLHLNMKLINDLIEQLKNKNSLVFLTGGEPFLHPHIWKILRSFSENNIFYGVCTNGTLLDKEGIKELSQLNLDHIMFSLHGPEKVHDGITGHKGNFQKIIETIQILKKTGTQSTIIVNCAILPDNISSLDQIIKICERVGADAVRFQHMSFLTPQEKEKHSACFSGHNGEVNQHITSDLNVYPAQLTKKIRDIQKKRTNIPIYFIPDLSLKELPGWYSPTFRTKRKCFFAFRGIFIDNRGGIFPCRTLKYKIGDLNYHTLKQTFNSTECKNFRKNIKKNLLPGCARCCKLRINF